MRSPQEAQQHAPLDEEREREAIEAGRMELHRLFHEEHGNDARELIRDNDGQYINEKTRDVWEWCEKIIMASLAHARKQQDLVTKEISLPGGDKHQEELKCMNCQHWGGDRDVLRRQVEDGGERAIDLRSGWAEAGTCREGHYWQDIESSCGCAATVFVPAGFGCPLFEAISGGRVEEEENGKERGDA